MRSAASRGSYVRNVLYENIRAENISSAALAAYTNYGSHGKVSNGPPQYSHIVVRNFTATNVKTAIELIGQPGTPLQDIELVDIDISGFKHASVCADANVSVARNISPALVANQSARCVVAGE